MTSISGLPCMLGVQFFSPLHHLKHLHFNFDTENVILMAILTVNETYEVWYLTFAQYYLNGMVLAD